MKHTVGVLLMTLSMTACGYPNSLIKEMEAAYSLRHADGDIDNVIRNKLPIGASTAKAKQFIATLEANGFQVRVYSHSGMSHGTAGPTLPFINEETRKIITNHLRPSESEYVVEYKYKSIVPPLQKTAVIIIRVDNDVVVVSQGRINTSSI